MFEKRIICPYCGYAMPVHILSGAECHGLKMKCKSRECKKEFEMIVHNGQQIRIRKLK